jgi:hypothetical protein
MGKQTIWSKIREFISGIAWRVFLWANQMTNEEYMQSIEASIEADRICRKIKSAIEKSEAEYTKHCKGEDA